MLKFHPEGAKIILISTLITVLGIFGVDHLFHESNEICERQIIPESKYVIAVFG